VAKEDAYPAYLAFDLGASSGRAIVGRVEGEQLLLEEVHRFPNQGVLLPSGLHWNVLQMWDEIQKGLRKGIDAAGDGLQSLGVDSWGVDYALLGRHDELLGNPYHYRDQRTDNILEEAFSRVPRAEIYRRTGVQIMQINSLFQLLAQVQAGSPLVEQAEHFLNIPDLFNFWLSGAKVNEFTIATTTQCYNPHLEHWDDELLEQMGVPSWMFGSIVQPGTILGELRPALSKAFGVGFLPVIATAGHDTACAVAAVPASEPDFVYLSSGTWSLLGIEVEEPIISEGSMAAQVTNEGGVGGTFRFLKNITGLWLLQECRREWQQAGTELSYDQLTEMAAAAPPFQAFILSNERGFLAPGNMPARIQAFCRESGQEVPQSRGEIVRVALESLALEYRFVVERLAELAGRTLPVIHIIGGGSQNRLLNQFTANATRRPVVAGPVEATATGNILVQQMALGQLTSVAAGRSLVRRSFTLETFEPEEADRWDEAYEDFLKLKEARR
jgi:rhamnulokinase